MNDNLSKLTNLLENKELSELSLPRGLQRFLVTTLIGLEFQVAGSTTEGVTLVFKTKKSRDKAKKLIKRGGRTDLEIEPDSSDTGLNLKF